MFAHSSEWLLIEVKNCWGLVCFFSWWRLKSTSIVLQEVFDLPGRDFSCTLLILIFVCVFVCVCKGELFSQLLCTGSWPEACEHNHVSLSSLIWGYLRVAETPNLPPTSTRKSPKCHLVNAVKVRFLYFSIILNSPSAAAHCFSINHVHVVSVRVGDRCRHIHRTVTRESLSCWPRVGAEKIWIHFYLRRPITQQDHYSNYWLLVEEMCCYQH